MLTIDFSKLQFASTRYLGSKRKSISWMFSYLDQLGYDNCLDAMGGTGIVSFEFKKRGKEVHYNDILKSNFLSAKALIENKGVTLTNSDLDFILDRHKDVKYDDFIQRTFKGVFFTDAENRWLDMTIANVKALENPYKQAIAFHCICQASIIKRPFNLFHRKNLYIRLAKVSRNFGNKITWERPFEYYFRKFSNEANAAIFDNNRSNLALNHDIFDFAGERPYDLVYIDPPYICTDGDGTDYFRLYGFLEGLIDYDNWGKKIHQGSRNTIWYPHVPDWWTKKTTVLEAFDKVFKKFRNSMIVVSYRHPGTPSKNSISRLLKKYKSQVELHSRPRQFALSADKTSREILFIGK